MLDTLRRGGWVNPTRIRTASLSMLFATVLAAAFLLATGHGTIDRWGRPIGTDFSDVYAAGRMALHGHAVDAWNWPLHYREQQTVHANTDGKRPVCSALRVR